ncbi:MAG: hypothetical protein LBB41_04575 [Prevotellaceae bacterium]|jgi:hypothetical protein|nr:hypothetical protein [Prevotellaceae bacterium]
MKNRNNIEHNRLQGLITDKQSACCNATLYAGKKHYFAEQTKDRYYNGTKHYPIFQSPDRLWVKYPSLMNYHYCGNNPIMISDSTDEFPLETIWDIGNVLYDVGAAVVNHIKGDCQTAKSN